MRLLVISSTPWSPENSFGSTYESIFSALEGIEVINIYCNTGTPESQLVKRVFQIDESMLLRSIIRPTVGVGRELPSNPDRGRATPQQGVSVLERLLAAGRARRFSFYGLALMARSVIWRFGRWRSAELNAFLLDSRPDLIFVPVYSASHMNRLVHHAKETLSIPMVGYVSDDVYSLRQFSLSPWFWASRFYQRILIRRVVDRCHWLYVVSDVQRRDYERALGVECRVLTKLGRFSEFEIPPPPEATRVDRPVVFTYAGNIGNRRWRTLLEIGEALGEASEAGAWGRLDVYTMTPLTRRQIRQFQKIKTIEIHPALRPGQLREVYRQSDVLVLAEPTSLKGRLQVRHSISTKVVEYLEAGRPILARAHRSAAFIQHLQTHGAAMVSMPGDDLVAQVTDLIQNRQLRLELAQRGWRLGAEKHDQEAVGQALKSELSGLLRAGGAHEDSPS